MIGSCLMLFIPVTLLCWKIVCVPNLFYKSIYAFKRKLETFNIPSRVLCVCQLFNTLFILNFLSVFISLFGWISLDHLFAYILQAFKSMFQIMVNDGWIDVAIDLMVKLEEGVLGQVLVAIYFIAFHLFVSLVSTKTNLLHFLSNFHIHPNFAYRPEVCWVQGESHS